MRFDKLTIKSQEALQEAQGHAEHVATRRSNRRISGSHFCATRR